MTKTFSKYHSIAEVLIARFAEVVRRMTKTFSKYHSIAEHLMVLAYKSWELLRSRKLKTSNAGEYPIEKKDRNSERIRALSLEGRVIPHGWIHERVPIPLDLAVITRWKFVRGPLLLRQQFWVGTCSWDLYSEEVPPLLFYHAKRTKDWLLHHVSQPYTEHVATTRLRATLAASVFAGAFLLRRRRLKNAPSDCHPAIHSQDYSLRFFRLPSCGVVWIILRRLFPHSSNNNTADLNPNKLLFLYYSSSTDDHSLPISKRPTAEVLRYQVTSQLSPGLTADEGPPCDPE
ncbi:hypothetical protein QE152_g15199 [Popillia japonica]|uniref:Uncharacterized protein n=1 Tax=Popillia japonica TaxID=7064 RepID=A0AAW1L8U1_POPJA